MIFLSDFEKISNQKIKVNFIHYMPFHEKHGLGRTKEELEQEGILVDSIPEPEDNGKIPILYINPETKETWYEYEEPPLTEEQKLDLLNEKLDLIMMNQLEMEGVL